MDCRRDSIEIVHESGHLMAELSVKTLLDKSFPLPRGGGAARLTSAHWRKGKK
jgi:hypothetical protein